MDDRSTRPFGMRDKLGYLLGDFGNDFTFLLSSSFLMKFYTDVMGVSAAVVGVIMMIARFVDSFTDVTMGRICDRSRITRHGKFKPWIRRMCGPVAVASFLIYQGSLAGMPMPFKVGYLFVTYILWGSVFYTTINIPYGSMASAISPEPDDRQSLSTFRSLGGTLANTFIGVVVPLIAYTTDAAGNTVMNGGRFTLVAGICSVLAVACHLGCFYLTSERVIPKSGEKQPGVLQMFRNALVNRALISVIVASVLLLLAQLTMQSMNGYVYPNYYRSASAQSASTLLMMAAMLLAGALAKPLARYVGKAESAAAACVLAMLALAALYLLRPTSVWVYVAIQTVAWFGLGVYNMVSWAMITDVIDYSELKNGVREDGSIYALYSFARKLGQAASAGLSGALLSIIGYSQATAFDAGVVNGIYGISTLLPALSFALLALVLWFWYPLHRRQVNANVAALKQKRHGN